MPESIELPFTSGCAWNVCSLGIKWINYSDIQPGVPHMGGRFEYQLWCIAPHIPGSQDNLGWKRPQQVSSLTSCLEQGQLSCQTRLLRALPSLGLQIPKTGNCTTSLSNLFIFLAVLMVEKCLLKSGQKHCCIILGIILNLSRPLAVLV